MFPRILLYPGHGLIGAATRWQTWGPYGHAALWVGEDEVIEADAFQGVVSRRADDVRTADVFHVETSEDVARSAIAFARKQIGKPYDWGGVLRFLSRRPESLFRWQDSWFCSELVYAAFMAGGQRLLRSSEPWRVSPSLLGLSPLLAPGSRPDRVRDEALAQFGDPRINRWRAELLAGETL